MKNNIRIAIILDIGHLPHKPFYYRNIWSLSVARVMYQPSHVEWTSGQGETFLFFAIYSKQVVLCCLLEWVERLSEIYPT